jgi:RecJ-like exonuclease
MIHGGYEYDGRPGTLDPMTCPDCLGAGGTDEEDCLRCEGNGTVMPCTRCGQHPVRHARALYCVDCTEELSNHMMADLAERSKFAGVK